MLSRLDALARLARALVDDRPALAGDSVDPSLVRRHGLGPMAFTHGLTQFRDDYIVSTLRVEQRRATACEAIEVLSRRGVPVAALKGISYAGWLYPDPAERPMTDVDLLVPPARYREAIEALVEIGYRYPWVSSRFHAVQLKRPHASLDLHQSPVQRDRIAIDLEGVWRRAGASAWLPGARQLEPVDETLLHFANLARSDLIAPLHAFVDAGRLLRKVDREELLARAREWRFSRVLDLVLGVVEHALGRSEPPAWWLPQRLEVLRGDMPPRMVQIGRKLLLVEGPRELVALARAAADGVVQARRGRRS